MAVIGVMIEGQEGLTWDRWRNLCRVVEDLGFESLWRSDHFFSVMGEYQRDCIETWVSLALCAEWGLGGRPEVGTYRHKVELLAEQCKLLGRDPKEIKRSFQSGYLVGRDDKALLERADAMREVIPRYRDMKPAEVVEAARQNWLVGTP